MTLHIESQSYQSTSVSKLIDCVHSAFDQPKWPHVVSTLSVDAWLLSKLLVHEWVANLVQHANFGEASPEIRIHFERNGDRVRYVIEDNSVGFDLDAYLSAGATVKEVMPDRGMGLLILSSCSEEVAYRRVGHRHNRLEFVLCEEPVSVDVGVAA